MNPPRSSLPTAGSCVNYKCIMFCYWMWHDVVEFKSLNEYDESLGDPKGPESGGGAELFNYKAAIKT